MEIIHNLKIKLNSSTVLSSVKFDRIGLNQIEYLILFIAFHSFHHVRFNLKSSLEKIEIGQNSIEHIKKRLNFKIMPPRKRVVLCSITGCINNLRQSDEIMFR